MIPYLAARDAPTWHGGCTYSGRLKPQTTSQEITPVATKKHLSRLLSILILALSLALVGCGGDWPDLNTPAAGNPEQTLQDLVETPEALTAGTAVPGTPTASP